MINKIIHGDCLEEMKNIKDKSIDMILCDLPYGTTGVKWDVIIPFDKLWEQYERIITDNGAIVLTASQPFTSKLISSNLKMFRYEWIWEKSNGSGFANAKKMPMKRHENICVFYKHLPTYNPQDLIKLDKPITTTRGHRKTPGANIGVKKKNDLYRKIDRDNCTINFTQRKQKTFTQSHTNYPNSMLKFSMPKKKIRIHPTQKPLELWEYLIKTYTNDGDLVLDNTSGSGVTAIACVNTNRNFICMELEEEFFNKSNEWLTKVLKEKSE